MFDLFIQRVQDIHNLARCHDVFVQNKQVLYWPNSRRVNILRYVLEKPERLQCNQLYSKSAAM